MSKLKYYSYFILLVALVVLQTGCKKLIEIDPPTDTIDSEQMFSDNTQPEWAVAGIYSKMIHGTKSTFSPLPSESWFSAGLSTILGSFSSDEMINLSGATRPELYYLNKNQLTVQRATLSDRAWVSAYKTIYDANAVIEGLAASTSPVLLDSVKKQLTGEALALRSFAYFYLVNFFGDVPLALTIDYSKTIGISRSPVARVYEQIINDLVKARGLLDDGFSVGKNERVRVNKWFAEALLARVYLYTGQYQNAVTSATNVINKTDYFSLEQDLGNVFSPASREAIFQLKPNSAEQAVKNGTPEGFFFLPVNNGVSAYSFSSHFLSSFEANDQRKSKWMLDISGSLVPYKYTVSRTNANNGAQPQYYMVMRLAEMYLVRAEAALLSSAGNKNNAIADLNVLRNRADLDDLATTLSADEVKIAIANERKFELFAEWGHRWLDLKRTGMAVSVFSQIPEKLPWEGDHQLLYPVPVSEIINNRNISQNPGYEVQ